MSLLIMSLFDSTDKPTIAEDSNDCQSRIEERVDRGSCDLNNTSHDHHHHHQQQTSGSPAECQTETEPKTTETEGAADVQEEKTSLVSNFVEPTAASPTTPPSSAFSLTVFSSRDNHHDGQQRVSRESALVDAAADAAAKTTAIVAAVANIDTGSLSELREKSRTSSDHNDEVFCSDLFTPTPLKTRNHTIIVELPPSLDPLRRSNTTMSSVDSEMLEKQVMLSNQEDEICDGFISQIGRDGNIEQVPVKYTDNDKPVVSVKSLDGDVEAGGVPSVAEEAPPSISDFIGADILAKPFNFVSGNSASNRRFLPFRKKKSGLLNVLAKQATRNRLVAKNGAINTLGQSEGKAHKYFKDFFITLLDISWSWIFFLFAAAFSSSWLLFAVVWYVTFWQHGDFDEQNRSNDSFRPCVTAINDFTSCFLYSIETQHTIGYGTRAITEECPLSIVVMCLQSIVGVIIQACMAGVIFAKFTVPRKRGETIIFSKNAVVTMRNGCLFLLCRISDLRKYSLLEAHVRMIVIRKEKTDEGEIIPYQQTDLECGSEVNGTNDRVLIFWPVTIAHKIDEDSPFYEMTPRDFLSQQFEVVVTLEGVTEETGNTVQARTSYLPNEILWGHHFENAAVAYDKKAGMYSVQHSIINKTVVDLTPRCSARQLAQRRDCKRTSSAMTNTSSSEEVSPRAMCFRVEHSSTNSQ